MDSKEDYHIAKHAGKTASKGTKKDRALDDLVFVAQQHEIGVLPSAVQSTVKPKPPAKVHINIGIQNYLIPMQLDVSRRLLDNKNEDNADDNRPDSNGNDLDSQRVKKILDEVRPEAYREFSHSVTRGLERIRKDLGEGRVRLVIRFNATIFEDTKP